MTASAVPTSVVTIGAGQAAAVTARTLRRRGFAGRITLIGDEHHQPYQRPPLSKDFLLAPADTSELGLLTPRWLAENEVEVITGTHVDKIELDTRTVALTDSRLDADVLVLATGTRPRRLVSTGVRPDRVHYLRTIDDAVTLAGHLRSGTRLAIIGGGFVALEVAATATELGVESVIVERSPHLLGGRFSGAGRFCAQAHRSHGVEIRTGTGVDSVHTGEQGVVITTSSGERIEVDTVVIAIGVVANDEVALRSGLDCDQGILVDQSGQTRISGVFAAGDVAARFSPTQGRYLRSGHFDNANRSAAAVADAIMGRAAPADEIGWFWSDQYGTNLQFLGSAGPTSTVITRGDRTAGEFCEFYLEDGILAGAFAADRGEDVMAARELIGTAPDPVQLADTDIDLWELLDGLVA